MKTKLTASGTILMALLALSILAYTTPAAYADTRQSNSCTPECSAGANPQPWGVGARGNAIGTPLVSSEDARGNPGTSMAPQVPAGQRPNPNP